MAIQTRRGSYDDFDPAKMLPGELATVTSGDPGADDGRSVYACFAAGDVKRMATYEDMQENISQTTQDIQEDFTAQLTQKISQADTAISQAQTATSAANIAAQGANEAKQEALEAAEAAESYVLGDISNKTVVFSEASTRENINTGESTSTLFGKIKKWFSDLGAAAFHAVANNLTTNTEGSVLDARQGKVLGDAINQLNTKTTPEISSPTLGPKFTGSIGCAKIGKIVIATMELTPSSSVANDDLVASGLPAAYSKIYTALTATQGNYTAVIDTDGTLKIYYTGQANAGRIDCTLCYVCAQEIDPVNSTK